MARPRKDEVGPAFGSVPRSLSVRTLIDACPLLRALPANQKKELERDCFLSFAQKGEVVFDADAPRRFEIIVGEGRVDLLDSKDQVAETIGPGQCSVRIATLEGGAGDLTAVTACATWYLKTPRRFLQDLYARDPEFRKLAVAVFRRPGR